MSDLIPGLGAHVLGSGTLGFHKEELVCTEKQHFFTDPRMFKEASSAKAHNSLEFVTGQLKPPSKVEARIFSEELGVRVRVEIAHHFHLWCVCV